MATPRERVARALCRQLGHPENIKFEGELMWRSFLNEAQAALDAANVGPLLEVVSAVARDPSVREDLRQSARSAITRYNGA